MRSLSGLAAVFLVGLLALTAPSQAWSYKEHILFTRLAAVRLLADPATPAAMKNWLARTIGDLPGAGESAVNAEEHFFLYARVGTKPQGFTGLTYWSYMPDVHALTDPPDHRIQPFGVHERVLHYIDLELLIGGDLRREYRHDLSNKPRPGDIPRDMHDQRYVQAGMLPFRIEYCYERLVQSVRDGQLDAPTIEQQEGKTATYWAGYLAHYVADNTQPHHATLDYKSHSYFANKRKAPNIHNEVEWRMCDDEANDFMSLRTEYWPLLLKQLAEFQDPVQTEDLWQASVEVSLRSYDALPLIGMAAMQAAGQGGTPEQPQGEVADRFDTEAFFRFRGSYMGREMSVMEMKAIQTAWAVKRIERTWKQAWERATATGAN